MLKNAVFTSIVNSGDRVLVALSGGADSVALLILLRKNAEKLGITLEAAHLNHLLRGGESDRDAAFCKALCDRLSVPLTLGIRDVSALRENGEGVEEAARRVRYGFLLDVARERRVTKIVTAHNANDLAETMLMNLARGSGTRGLAGIPQTRDLGGVTLVRPLLFCERSEIEEYLEANGETYVTDSSNLADDYTRNMVRHQILPLLQQVNPQFVRHAAQAAQSLREDDEALETFAAQLVCGTDENPAKHPTEILAASLAASSAAPAVAARAVKILAENAGAPSPNRAQIAAVLNLAAAENPSAEVTLSGGYVARRNYEKLEIVQKNAENIGFQPKISPENPGFFKPQNPAVPAPLTLGTTRFGAWTLTLTDSPPCCAEPPRPDAQISAAPQTSEPPQNPAETHVFALPARLCGSLFVRSRREGDSFSHPTRGWTKPLKKLFIELKIPKNDRDFSPVICLRTEDGREIVAAAPPLGVSRGFEAETDKKMWLICEKTADF